ncbi:hypothetical protein [Microtetraspora malaysiensis]|uniref:hypothetical protein n=1 Tax=Microtetraspora malaysiensis TaxID=161358 RepID=UPI003D8C2213
MIATKTRAKTPATTRGDGRPVARAASVKSTERMAHGSDFDRVTTAAYGMKCNIRGVAAISGR